MSLHLSRLLSRFYGPVVSPVTGEEPEPLPAPVDVHLGGVPVSQMDSYTCGALALLMLEATGDPDLAAELEQHPERIVSYQKAYLAQAQKRGIGPFRWPEKAGIPPWTLAREARFPGVTYTHRPVDDTTDESVFNAVLHAVNAGIPVPLYVGGNLTGGLGRAVPRHVVLAVPPTVPTTARSLTIFEPSSGKLHVVRLSDLLNRKTRSPALGGWTHVVWAVLPQPVNDTQ